MTLTNRKPPSPYYQQCEERKPWGISNPWTGKSASLRFWQQAWGEGVQWMAGEAEKQKPWERKEPEPQMSTAGGTRHAGTFPAPLLCELREQNRYDQPGFIQEVYEKPHVIRTGIAPHSYSNRMQCDLHPFIFYGCKLSVLGISEYLTNSICRFKKKKSIGASLIESELKAALKVRELLGGGDKTRISAQASLPLTVIILLQNLFKKF